MATYAHLTSPPLPPSERVTGAQRQPNSRIPTKLSNTPSASGASQRASRMVRSASRGVAPLDKLEHGAKGIPEAHTLLPAAHPSSLLPRRSIIQSSAAPHPSFFAPRPSGPPPPATIRTPSLVSGSSVSTYGSPRSIGLRRKPSIIDKYVAQKRTDLELDRATMHSRSEEYRETFNDSVFGISVPSTSTYATKELVDSPAHAKEACRQQRVPRHVTPPMPAYAPSATPPTVFTASPFSSAPTPSSASSYSHSTALTCTSSTSPGDPSPVQRQPSAVAGVVRHGSGSRLGMPRESEAAAHNSSSKLTSSNTSSVPARKEVPRKPFFAPPSTQTSSVPRIAPSPKASARVSQPNPAIKAAVRIPPELAHLNIEPPSRPLAHKPLPPIRPSREGALNITGLSQPSAVVHSDLPSHYSTYHKRTPSQEIPASPRVSSPSFRSRLGLASRSSSRQSSPRVDSCISSPSPAYYFPRGPTPDNTRSETLRPQRTDSPAVGPAFSSIKPTRFGFLSRKPKIETPKLTEKPKRQPKKGPIAGTGHEGYGRFGFGGRSGSTASSNEPRSPSADSTGNGSRPAMSPKGSLSSRKDCSASDDFLKDHSTPILLRGGGGNYSAVAATSRYVASTPESSNTSLLASVSNPQLLSSATLGTPGELPVHGHSHSNHVQSDSSEEFVATHYPTLAAWRSSNRSSQVEKRPSQSVTHSLDLDPHPHLPPAGVRHSQTPTFFNGDPSFSGVDDYSESREGLWLRPQLTQNTNKPLRKWNFFQRAQASPRPKGKTTAELLEKLPAPNAHGSFHCGLEQYGMPDLLEPVDLYEVEQMMQENESSVEENGADGVGPVKIVPYEPRHTSFLPSPPRNQIVADPSFRAETAPPRTMLRPSAANSLELLHARTARLQPMPPLVVDIPKSPVACQSSNATCPLGRPIKLSQVHSTSTSASATPEAQGEYREIGTLRQPRLSPIGRIPMVISKRDRDRKLPDNSFSRPFVRTQPHPSVKPPGKLYNQIRASREMVSLVDTGSQPVSSATTSTSNSTSDGVSAEVKSSMDAYPPSASSDRTSMDYRAVDEFLAFTPRNNSQASQSSSSGSGKWMAALTAQPPQQDDPWTEYNDLLDDMTGSSFEVPLGYSSTPYDPTNPLAPIPLSLCQPPFAELPLPPRSGTVPTASKVLQRTADTTQLRPRSGAWANQRDSQISIATGMNTKSGATCLPRPVHTSTAKSKRVSVPNPRASMTCFGHSRASLHSRTASLPEATSRHSQSSTTASARFNRNTQLLGISGDDRGEQAAQANLRVGALMTSKWLSFGRVLVSPAHYEMRLSDEPRVLVVDGLGSDWSYYVALSYPAASVYNLGPAPMNGSTSWPGISQRPSKNHQHIRHSLISAAFPFPKGFFTAVVFRFPLVTTDSAYQTCISECKRVLKPGGHLEVAVLDLDLMNMGTRARNLVRGLKTRLQQHDHDVSLRNLSDELVRLIGRRGFEGIQRCIVGVPTAGRIPRSQDTSSLSSSASENEKASHWKAQNSPERDLDFVGLLNGARSSEVGPGAGNDEGITKMVAKVGRWWFSSCYESRLLSRDGSIWNDCALLRECEKQGTSFKLLICYAQKPTSTMRRTVSV